MENIGKYVAEKIRILSKSTDLHEKLFIYECYLQQILNTC